MDSTDGFNYDEAKYKNENNKMMALTMNVFFSLMMMLLTNAITRWCWLVRPKQ